MIISKDEAVTEDFNVFFVNMMPNFQNILKMMLKHLFIETNDQLLSAMKNLKIIQVCIKCIMTENKNNASKSSGKFFSFDGLNDVL